MSSPAEPTIAQSAFEGLFVRVLKPTGAFREELRQAGYDMDREQPAYSLRVWDAALKVAARHVHPTLSTHEALRRLGEQFVDGFFETIIGKLLAAPMPLLGPDMVLERLARMWESGAPGISVVTQQEGPGRWTVTVRHPSPQTDFDLGLLRGGLRRAGVDATCSVAERRPDGYTARVHWAAKG